jgi:hypothetical protein
MKTYGGVDIWIHVLTLAVVAVSGQLHALTTLPPPVPIGYEAGWAPEPVWMTWRREIVRLVRTIIVAVP